MTRLEFLLSPLALLGLRKSEPKDEPHPYPFYGTWKKCAEEWEKTARLRDKDAEHLSHRLRDADKDTDLWRELSDNRTERALTAEKALKEAHAVIDEAWCLLEASRPCMSTYQADALMVLREKNSSTTTRITKRKTA